MIQVVQILKSQMDTKFLEDLHTSVFQDCIPGDFFRYDLCLVAKDEKDNLISYALVREISSETVELAWGGTTQEHRGFISNKVFKAFTDKCLEHFLFVTFQTRTKNTPMIRLGLAHDYFITGTRIASDNELYVIFTKRRD